MASKKHHLKEISLGKYVHRLFFLILISHLMIEDSSGNDLQKNIDLIPIEPDANIIEFGFSTYNPHNFIVDELFNTNVSSQEVKSSNKLNFGIKNSNNVNYIIDLSYDLSSYDKSFILKNAKHSLYKSKFTLLSREGLYSFPDWKYYSTASINHHEFDTINCYQGTNVIIRKKNSSCIQGNRTLYETTNDPVKIHGETLSIGFGARKTSSNWESKNVVDLGINSHRTKYTTDFDTVFNSLDELYKINFPQNKAWFSNNLHLGFITSRQINKDFGLGLGLTFYKAHPKNYTQGFKKIKNQNIKIDGKLTKNFSDRFYISFGGFYSSNFLLGIRPHEYRRGNENLFNRHYGELSLNFGLIKKSVNIMQTKQINNLGINELYAKNIKKINSETVFQNNLFKNSNSKINFSPKKLSINKIGSNVEKNKAISITNNAEDKNNLIEFALSFAKKYDKQDLY